MILVYSGVSLIDHLCIMCVIIFVEVDQELPPYAESIIAYEETDVILPCSEQPFGSLEQIMWTHNGLPLDIAADSRLTLMSSGYLRINGVGASDSGVYQCGGTDGVHGTAWTSNEITLRVFGEYAYWAIKV